MPCLRCALTQLRLVLADELVQQRVHCRPNA
jgi:hypothetical protein